MAIFYSRIVLRLKKQQGDIIKFVYNET